MSDRHVVPADDGWHVEKKGAQRASARAATQAEAIMRALEIVANDGGGDVVVHGVDGAVRETRAVAGNADVSTADSAVVAAGAAANGVRQTASAAADEAFSTARTVTGEATGAARNAADTAQDAAESVSEAAEDVAADARAASHRARDEVAETARDAADSLVTGADRAAVAGENLGDRFEHASHRTGRTIHDVTERAARPLDAAARALNPVRVAGRTAGVVLAGVLHVGAAVTGCGARLVQNRTRRGTGRS